MSDPVRWKQGGGAPTGVDALLRRAPRPRAMTAAERARVAARLAQIPAVLGPSIGWAAWVKGIIVVAGVGVAALAVHGLVHDRPASIVAAVQHLPSDRLRAVGLVPSVLPVAQASEAAPAEPDPALASAKPGPRSPGHIAPALDSAAPALDADTLLREAELLEKARSGIARDPEASLRALDQHREGFGDGQLTAERELLAIDALARQGRAEEARARAGAFLVRFPASPYADRVRRIVGTNP